MSEIHYGGSGTMILTLQIQMLHKALETNVASWITCGLPAETNPVADSIRRDIAEKQALLAANWA